MNHTKYRISSILSAHRYAGQRPTSSMGQSVCIRSGVAELNTPDLNTPAMESTTRMSTGRIMYAGPPRTQQTRWRSPAEPSGRRLHSVQNLHARMAAAAAQIMVGRSFFPAPKYPRPCALLCNPRQTVGLRGSVCLGLSHSFIELLQITLVANRAISSIFSTSSAVKPRRLALAGSARLSAISSPRQKRGRTHRQQPAEVHPRAERPG